MKQQGNAETLKQLTRRHFFAQTGFGIGSIALSALLNGKLLSQSAAAAEIEALNPMAPKPSHYAPKAKRIIYLFMAGGPSQVDMFDPKPKLIEFNGQEIPQELIKGQRFAFIKGTPKLLGSPHKFKQYGQCGAPVSDLMPHTAQIVDDIAFIKTMHTDQFNHGPAQIFMNTGHQIIGRPSMGSWLTYGLGSESNDLPGFVVLLSGEIDPGAGNACWSSGFLPTTYQGVPFRSQGDPVLFVSNPEGVSAETRRRSLDLIRTINQKHLATTGDPEIATRIAAYEMAYRMQKSVPELAELANEPEHIHKLYGTEPGKVSFANNCLLARRLVERGCRFVQLYHRGWDHHGESPAKDLMTSLPRLCRETDQACAALVKDLKQRGLLEDTLVIWGGEFGRTPMNEERGGSKFLGRDHHPKAFTMWLAGGGVKGGVTVGKTDELGYNPAVDPVHVHDLHATVLHLMGLDHEKLTFKFQGRDYRLTDVHGHLVKKLYA
ncbi:MAG TPA: DUF1501 domain-containing protein [Planctomycetota bacterium]|nr:DUF1501 domain-containing protein [Planctomycetota bacterium]